MKNPHPKPTPNLYAGSCKNEIGNVEIKGGNLSEWRLLPFLVLGLLLAGCWKGKEPLYIKALSGQTLSHFVVWSGQTLSQKGAVNYDRR
jgi:hypothetical protein